MIAIIDLKLGNVRSVGNALAYLHIKHVITSDPEQIHNSKQIIFPGVGSFHEASRRLMNSGMRDCIRNEVLVHQKPILGICLGMQLLAETGDEGGKSQGLGLINAHVSRLRTDIREYRLPHIGWNDVRHENIALFKGIKSGACFYFVHSYELMLDESCENAICNYGVDFVAAVQKGKICGTQFHPEKSREMGLRLLKNFTENVF